jgi:thiosulfate reductase cytochrome b subunit
MASLPADQFKTSAPGAPAQPRHCGWVRLCHWLNAVAIIAMIPTGLVILAYHPELYWGETGYFGDPAVLSFAKEQIEIWSLGKARSFHFIAAWVFVFASASYLVLGLASGHFGRRILPEARELAPGHLAREVADHARLRHLGHDRPDYNTLQKLAYAFVIFVAGPLMLLTGLAMSPDATAVAPWLIDMFGGRQTARTLHFFGMVALTLFVLIHVWQVWLVGFRREVTAMITGNRTPGKDEA